MHLWNLLINLNNVLTVIFTYRRLRTSDGCNLHIRGCVLQRGYNLHTLLPLLVIHPQPTLGRVRPLVEHPQVHGHDDVTQRYVTS